MINSLPWRDRIGYQRDWVWRGWQIRYTFTSPVDGNGDKPPLILLHGFGASIEHWRHNIPALSQHHRVYALDLLGFGASRKAKTDYNIDLWVEQIHDFWRGFIGRPVVIVGNSIGSLVGLGVAGRYPETMAGLVMLSLPDVSRRREMFAPWVLNIVTPIERLFTSPRLIKPLFYWLRRPGVLRKWAVIAYEDNNAVSDELLEILSAPTLDEDSVYTFCALCQSANKPEFCPSSREILPRLKIPMLLCWGRQDRMVPISLAAGFVSLNERIEYAEFDRAGHCLQDECPDRFNPVLIEWLKKHFHQEREQVQEDLSHWEAC
ncbi:MAG: 2-hydroxy-6-oxo-6-(2'-aminophenyl)hexa-2,4-dienoic acid hydrolase [Chroococcopsis gigantea SAG 12.99]|nr:2-hydroxy-6-oxo-6-(2'-aminophenyl)hexa-2,4-dienoic acid hydrolase [Chroococcopsis gigantea SAG 12.99]